MDFRTIVNIPEPTFSIGPQERMLFVGSCFADNIGRRFVEEKFRATVNPFGVMYNPCSILHTVERCDEAPRVALFTLGTNHVYRLKETGEIVDNCLKRPQRLFQEEELSVETCLDYLQRAVDILAARNPEVQVVVTVSPIRYAKYGYHGSQLSKATLLLAADRLVKANDRCSYFPAYEIVNDELRDYRSIPPAKPWSISGNASLKCISVRPPSASLRNGAPSRRPWATSLSTPRRKLTKRLWSAPGRRWRS